MIQRLLPDALLLLVTGRRHQLRLHLHALGVPILGDGFYPTVLRGPGAPDDAERPLQLLARALMFDDPFTGTARRFESTLTLAASQGQWPGGCAAVSVPQAPA